MTAAQLAAQYRVNIATIRRARARAHLPARTKAAPDYSESEAARIAAHLRASPPPRAPSSTRALTEKDTIKLLTGRIATLELQVAALQAQIATHDHLLGVIVTWGKNTARIIRALWRRMPDYEAGDTPAEFPAVRLDAIGSEELAAQRAIEQETSAFFDALDRKETSDDE